MNLHSQRLIFTVGFVLCCLLATSLPAMAETDSGDDRWKLGGAAYFWFSGIEATDIAGDKIDISFSDLLDSLDGGIMGVVAARKGRWTLLGDIQYLKISDKTSATANIIGQPAEIDLDFEQTGFVSTFGVAYRVLGDDRTNLDLMVGGRYVKMDVDIEAAIGMGTTRFSGSDSALDGIIGAQAQMALNDRWYLSFYADVGAGGTELTWQVWPNIGYRFKSFDAVAGYRYLKWDVDDGDVFDDLSFGGPALGVVFSF